ncbi:homocitrate synthase [Mycobacterium sp. 1423905.2]|uniref:homocitrate synthase n=1 Tax=Mycobacterium sp. 1423905.2 TaxID=1856859 RepID=UPI0007FC7829|nr:homocitrate synthase [Mycobacterium sp. 1423905.2]OBJ56496.1 homocitrate synthase [Mycobacterium sp. 1423905.2]
MTISYLDSVENASASDALAGPSARRSAASSFVRQFGVALPRGLREQAEAISWESFVATFAPTTGPLRLGQWACIDPERPAGRLGPQPRNYRAMVAIGDSITAATASASGPVAALTAMLHGRGITVEILRFHQFDTACDTAAFVYGSNGARAEWGLGMSADRTQSALRALIACANRLTA